MGDPDDAILRAVGARVAELRRERGLTQDALAQRLGVSTKYLQRLEHGNENLTLRTLGRVAAEFQIEPYLLMMAALSKRPARAGRPSARGPAKVPPIRRVAPRPGIAGVIPLYSTRASAGTGGRADLAEISEWVVVEGHAVGAQSFVIRVEGDSMLPTIPDGALALFRAPVDAPDGKVLLVEIAEGGAVPTYLVKRVVIDWQTHRETGGMWATLYSANEAYEPIRVDLSADSGVRFVAELRAVLDPASG